MFNSQTIFRLGRDNRRHGEVFERWQPQFLKWGKSIESNDNAKAEFAIRQMHDVDDPSIVPVLVSLLPVSGNRFSAQLVRLLASFPEHEATEALASFAVLAPWIDVRNEAITELKTRPVHEYAPMFLSWLTSPVKSRWRVFRDIQGNVRYEHLALREGADENQLFAVERVGVGVDPVVDRVFASEPTNGLPTFFTRAEENDAIRNGTVNQYDRINRGRQVGAIHNDTGQEAVVTSAFLAQAADRERQMKAHNAVVSTRNIYVFLALEQTTGVALPRDPVDWWSWWDRYNEIHKQPKRTQLAIDRKKALYTRSVQTQIFHYGQGSAGTLSCFIAGTPVWTEAGLTPIEKIQPGDRVLSQDPESGELAFKLVIGKTLRPPAPLTRISVSGEEILTTKGHPMWVVNKGWRMAKFIEEGQELHGIQGGAFVHNVEILNRAEEAHNLVVADFSTYFVGETGVLVHDNTYRKPTRALVPGLVAN